MSFPDIFETDKNNIPTDHLCQGDIFTRFEDRRLPPVDPIEVGFMVLNYTCDLINLKDITYICICPIFKIDVLIESYLKAHPKKSEDNLKSLLIDNINILFNNKKKFFYFLPSIAEFEDSPAFADLSQISKLPIEIINDILDHRIGVLKNPWREKLGWMSGNIFNRVAIPDINKNVGKEFVEAYEFIQKFFSLRE